MRWNPLQTRRSAAVRNPAAVGRTLDTHLDAVTIRPSGSGPALLTTFAEENDMKTCLRAAAAIAAFALAGDAIAGIPLVNATCPGHIEVHADEGGPIYINGKEGKLKKFNDNYFEAKGAGVTISLSINPDGSPSISYTGKGGANGVCTIK